MVFLVNWMKIAAGIFLGWGILHPLCAAEYQTQHFEVVADSVTVARDIGEAAEQSRTTLARSWLDRPLGDWNFRCRIEVECRDEDGSGWTNYELLGGNVIRIGIEMQGSPDRLMDYVLPHEITHAILVTALGKTLPRWADEGAAMIAEAQSEQIRQRLVAEQLLKTGQAISFRKFLELEKYPQEKSRMFAFYAQSHSVTEYLIAHGGRSRFLAFVRDGAAGDWDGAIERHYRLTGVEALESAWSEWVAESSAKRNKNPREQILVRGSSTIGNSRKISTTISP